MAKISAISVSDEQKGELESLARVEGWRLVPKEEIPAVFPEPFRAKMDSAYVVASGTPSGVTYLMCNLSASTFRLTPSIKNPSR